MALKASGRGQFHEIDRFDGGLGWLAHPEEGMQRASHALVAEGEVWLIDPVDVPDLDAALADLGPVAGVVLLLDRHKRDGAALARRHDVAVHLPRALSGVASALDCETAVLDDGPGDYEVRTVVDNPLWSEAALYDGETLVVSESLGTVAYMTTGDERLGVHPMRRLTPPRQFRSLAVDRVLVGHGAGVHEDAAAAVRDAIDGSVRRAPALYLQALRRAAFG